MCAMLKKAIVVLLLDSCPNQVDVRRMGVYDVNLNFSENIFILERERDYMTRWLGKYAKLRKSLLDNTFPTFCSYLNQS